MNIILIIQARENSKRLKNKSILPIYKKKSSLEIILEKFKKFKEIDKIYVATGPKKTNKNIFKIILKNNVNIYFGSEKNVRKRFERIILKENADLIIRATADNPLVDLKLTEYLIKYIIRSKKISYLKFDEKFIPTGAGVEIFKKKFFFKHINKDRSIFAKEHVTYHMMNRHGAKYIKPPKKYLQIIPLRITIDNFEDYEFVKYIYSKIDKPDILKINRYFKNY